MKFGQNSFNMAETSRQEVMQSVKLEVDGMVHNVALSSSTAARLLAGDPTTIAAVVEAIRSSKVEAPAEVVEMGTEPKLEDAPLLDNVTLEAYTEPLMENIPEPGPSQELLETVESAVIEYPGGDIFEDSDSVEDDGFQWTEEPTWTFLNQYKLMADRFNSGREKKSLLWDELAKNMESFGYLLTGFQLNCRFKTLRSNYRKKVSTKTINTRATGPFLYQEAMKEIFALESLARTMPPVLQKTMITSDGNSSVMTWSKSATKLLIAEYVFQEERFRLGKEKKKTVWSEVADALKTNGISCTGEQCEGKWKSLLRAFRKAKALGLHQKSFIFYADMCQIQSLQSEMEEGAEDNEDYQLSLDINGKKNYDAERWGDEAVNLLLGEYKERVDRCNAGDQTVWQEISATLQDAGFTYTPDQTERKWKVLIRCFRRAQMSATSRQLFSQFDEMAELLGDQNAGMTEAELSGHELLRNWSDTAVNLYLSECQARHDEGTFVPSKHMWLEICDVMKENGFIFTEAQLKRKWISLKDQYFAFTTLNKSFAYSAEVGRLVDLSKQRRKASWNTRIKTDLYDKDVLSDDEAAHAGFSLWTDIAVQIFLSELADRKARLSMNRKQYLWEDVTSAMNSHGYSFSMVQVEHKWKNLLRSYRTAKQLGDKERFQYFDEMEKLVHVYEKKNDPPLAVDHMWGEDSIRTLLKTFTNRRSKYEGKPTLEFWEEIVEELRKKKHYFTADQVAYRWNLLLVTFKKHHGSDNSHEAFTYYNEMKDFAVDEEVDETIGAIGCLSKILTKCSCGKIKNIFDDHKSGCCICMGCDEANTCHTCSKWPPSRWLKIDKLRQKRPKDATKRSAASDGEELPKENEAIWTPEAVGIFVEGCLARKDKLAGDSKHDIWHEISAILQTAGHSLTTDQVSNKWKSLYKKYKQLKGSKNFKQQVPFYEQLSEIYAAYERREEILTAAELWTAAAVEAFLKEYKTRRSKTGKELGKNDWAVISSLLADKGYDFTRDQVIYRWKMLLQAYTKAKGSVKPSEYFPYYDQVDAIITNEEVDESVEYFFGGQSGVLGRCHCGKMKGSYDNHTKGCRICLMCSQEKPCKICSKWAPAIWKKIQKRGTSHKRRRGTSNTASDADKIEENVAENSDEETMEIDADDDSWAPEATRILLDEYKSRNDRFKVEPNDHLWLEISRILCKNGHKYNAKQSEHQWKLLVRRYFAGKKSNVKFEYAKEVRMILGARTQATTYRRALSSRLRARPKRKFPTDIGEAAPEVDDDDDEDDDDDDDEDDHLDTPHSSSVPSHSLRSIDKKKQSNVKFTTSANSPVTKKSKTDDLKLFLRDFVIKQIETEERSFARFKIVHDNKVKTLKELLSTLESE